LRMLSRTYDVDLHPGAGAPTDEALLKFVKMHGKGKLTGVAKIHFKNTKKVLK